VGVRDEATRRLVGTLGLDNEDKLAMVPDPTFSFEVEANEAECLIRRKKLDFSRPTVALYLLKTFKPAAALARYYQRKGWQVVSLTPEPYGDFDLYDISPLEWASIYRHFSLVVTDRFHGTIFSLKNLTPVVAVVSDPGKITEEGLSKPYSLLKLFGMEETHFLNAIGLEALDEVTRLTEAASERFDRARVSQTLSGLGEEYHRFIERIGRI